MSLMLLGAVVSPAVPPLLVSSLRRSSFRELHPIVLAVAYRRVLPSFCARGGLGRDRATLLQDRSLHPGAGRLRRCPERERPRARLLLGQEECSRFQSSGCPRKKTHEATLQVYIENAPGETEQPRDWSNMSDSA